MKKIILTIVLLTSTIYSFAQKVETKKDTLIITNYESINFIKIAGKVYKIKVELEVVKPEYKNWLIYDSTSIIKPNWFVPYNSIEKINAGCLQADSINYYYPSNWIPVNNCIGNFYK